jgi:hypothetical protein
VSPASIDTNLPQTWHVEVRARVKDVGSGTRLVRSACKSPSGEKLRDFNLKRVSGDATDGIYTGVCYVNNYSERGRWTTLFYAEDEAGNTLLSGSKDLENAGHSPYFVNEDTHPPDIQVFGGPTGATSERRPSFRFYPEIGATTLCSIDQGVPSFGPCTEIKRHRAASPLPDGDYVFRVQAADSAGNTAVAARSFTVLDGAPDVSIFAGPAEGSHGASTDAHFEFRSDGDREGDALECSEDGADFSACSSPLEMTGLADGGHSFRVRLRGSGAPPASRSFVVDTAAPDTAITAGPEGSVRARDASFEFSSEAGASFECRLDGPDYVPLSTCESPVLYENLNEGRYRFTVRAEDRAGNDDPTPAQRDFNLSAPAPTPPDPPPPGQEDPGPNGPTQPNVPATPGPQPGPPHGAGRVCVSGSPARASRCRVEPTRLRLGRDAVLTHLRWSEWDASAGAVARGRMAGGRGLEVRARLTLMRPRLCGEDLWFTRARVAYGPGRDEVSEWQRRPRPCL